MKFEVGDRVICNNSFERILCGMTGTVCASSPTWISVDWDDLYDGHSCNGKARTNHGYNVPFQFLEPEEEEETIDLQLDDSLI